MPLSMRCSEIKLPFLKTYVGQRAQRGFVLGEFYKYALSLEAVAHAIKTSRLGSLSVYDQVYIWACESREVLTLICLIRCRGKDVERGPIQRNCITIFLLGKSLHYSKYRTLKPLSVYD